MTDRRTQYITLGVYVTPATRIVSIIQPDPMKLECSVPEKYASFLKKGNTLLLSPPAGSSKRYKATIHAVDPRIDFSTRTIAVRADVANGNGGFSTSGSFVEIPLSAIATGTYDTHRGDYPGYQGSESICREKWQSRASAGRYRRALRMNSK